MNTKVWYLPYFEGVYHTQMIETYSNANACMVCIVCMVHTMEAIMHASFKEFEDASMFMTTLTLTIGNGSVRFGLVREGPNRTGLEPNRLKILKLEPNRTEPRNR